MFFLKKSIYKIHSIQKYTFKDFYCSIRLLLVIFRIYQDCREAFLFLSDVYLCQSEKNSCHLSALQCSNAPRQSLNHNYINYRAVHQAIIIACAA